MLEGVASSRKRVETRDSVVIRFAGDSGDGMQVTDAHLLGIALRHGSRLATLDHGLKGLVPKGYSLEEAICLIE